MAELEPLVREPDAWTLSNGLRVTERRIPIGTVGANFEARPGVALDVAGQLLKSLNSAVLRTGGAALRTVTVLVDEVLRPALESAGLPPGAVGLVRSADHEGARLLVSLPRLIPLVILRGSGETTAQLARLAAENGVRTLAHAEGGGVLYVHAEALPEKALAIAEASLDRLGVCNRLNLCLVDRAAGGLVPDLLALFRERGMEVRGDVEGATALDGPLGHEWANDSNPRQVTTCYVDSLDEAVRVANEETSGLAAGIVTEDPVAARAFLDGYRGTAAFWHATTRFTDGFALTGAPETGINVDWTPGPRGPVTYRDLWLRQYRVVGDGTQAR
jgi:glutamate-5-semialdehyde dehydrogenase